MGETLVSANEDRKFVIQAIPDKGFGVIATHPIDAGEVIISEAPLFTQSSYRDASTIAASLAPKSADEKRQYLCLTNGHKPNKFQPLQGIFETNALPLGDNMREIGAVASKAGIFLLCSRFNSSCTPNVRNYWEEDKGVIVMRALMPIVQGEELCISYHGQWQARDARQSRLKASFGFTCRCGSCSLDGDALIRSDRRREQLAILYDEIGNCASNPVLGVKKAKTALKLLGEEGLILGEDNFSYDAFQFCVSCSNLQLSKAWARKAHIAACLITGSGSELALKCSKFAKNPRAHRAWGCFRQKVVGLEGPDV